MPNHLTYKKDNTTRHVHPDAKSTQRLLEKAGFSRIVPSEQETAVSPPNDPFDFLPDNIAKALVEAGFRTLEQLATADAETLLNIEGLGNATLEKILEATAELS